MKNRFCEPSTHAGIAVLCQAAKVLFPAYGFVFDGLSTFFGSMAVALPERVRD